jgi:hypothetical protein
MLHEKSRMQQPIARQFHAAIVWVRAIGLMLAA